MSKSAQNPSGTQPAARRALTSPVPNVETQPYWRAANERKLLLKRCVDCGELHHYPRALCPFCFGETDWVESAGRGTIYAFSVMRAAPVPYVIAYVTLDEGPTLMTNIVDCAHESVMIGQRVRTTFLESADGEKIPVFRLEG